MTQEELSLELARYLVGHWETIALGAITVLGGLITATWMAARYWYERENAYLTRQLGDKDSYAKGVIEVMSQRLLSAQEEPQRLLRIINQHKKQLARLKEANAKLFHAADDKSGGSLWKEYSLLDMATELDSLIEFNLEPDPDDSNIGFINTEYKANIGFIDTEYKAIKRASGDKELDLKAVAPLMLFLLKVQAQKITQLDLSLAKSHHDLENSTTRFYESIIKIMVPLITEHTKRKESEDALVNIRDTKDSFITWINYNPWKNEEPADEVTGRPPNAFARYAAKRRANIFAVYGAKKRAEEEKAKESRSQGEKDETLPPE